MTHMKKLLLTIAIILPLAGVAQQNDKGTALPIIRTNEKALPIFEDGAGKPTGWWIINPKIRPDVYETSVKKLFFMNEKRDTLAFNIERGGMYDFIILQNGCDTATATDDTATLSTDLATGDIAIVKIGKHSIKVAIK